jgi:putative addiction module component (TIGR02574 family)
MTSDAHPSVVSHGKNPAPEERLALIGDLWDSLRARPEAVHVTPAQQRELDRRLDALDSDDAAVISCDGQAAASRLIRVRSA